MREYLYEANGERHHVSIQRTDSGEWKVFVGEREYEILLDERQSTRINVRIGGHGYHCHVDAQGDNRFVSWRGKSFAFKRIDPSKLDVVSTDSAHVTDDPEVRAPMPGRVVKVSHNAGDRVSTGDVILVLEAMKMEYALTAPFDGVIARLNCAVNDQVELGAVLAVLNPATGTETYE